MHHDQHTHGPLPIPHTAPRRPRAAHQRRPVLATGALAATLLALALPTPAARAAIGACGSDPAVVLSNGVTVDLSASIADDATDVQQVAYTLHAPAGTTVVAWIGTDGPLGPAETLRYVADDAPDTYDSSTTVRTGATGVSVTATMTLVPPVAPLASTSTSGRDRQALPLRLSL